MALFDVTLATDTPAVTDEVIGEPVLVFDDTVDVDETLVRAVHSVRSFADAVAVADSVSGVTIPSLAVVLVRALTPFRLRIDFSTNALPNTALTNPFSYQFATITPGARPIFAQEVFLPAGQAFPLYIEVAINEPTNCATYELDVTGALVAQDGSAYFGDPVQFKGIGEAPTVLRVIAASANTVQVQFTEPMDDNLAIRDPDNYVWDGGLTTLAVTDVMGSIVRITTTPMTPGQLYNLTVIGEDEEDFIVANGEDVVADYCQVIATPP